MRLRYRILAKLQYFAFAFYPKTTVLVCIISTVVINVCFGLVMSHVNNREVYNILLSVMTGATAVNSAPRTAAARTCDRALAGIRTALLPEIDRSSERLV